jgi:hypothetical protein
MAKAGRPKGSTNERADYIRELVIDAVDWKQLPEDLKQVSPRERLRFIASILNKVLPRPVPEIGADDQEINFLIVPEGKEVVVE